MKEYQKADITSSDVTPHPPQPVYQRNRLAKAPENSAMQCAAINEAV